MTMKMFGRARTVAVPTADGTFPQDEGAELRIPIEGSDGRERGALAISYSVHDPLVVRFRVESLDGREVLERVQLRTDIMAALAHPCSLPGLTVGKTGDGGLALVFHEGRVSFTVVIPYVPLVRLMMRTERLVPVDDLAEGEALGRASMRLADY